MLHRNTKTNETDSPLRQRPDRVTTNLLKEIQHQYDINCANYIKAKDLVNKSLSEDDLKKLETSLTA